MPVILRKCPHLDTLVFQGLTEYWKDKCRDACDCVSQEDKSRLLMKKIQIKGFRGTTVEMGVLAHFLKYFPCLKEIEIYAEENCTSDIFEHIVKLVNLYNESYRLVVHFLVLDSSYGK
ncbi:putative F-box protein At3g58950 [Brassica rapa]|uniref:putative F-box protein At3g58950 n=1 Tax=Brassica campestris TaxID=3711 RepID=UPI0004F169B8|nr:putative F-box protein At3g58950 [Brassica rapa]